MSKSKKELVVSESQKRAVSALRRAEKRREDELKYTLGVYVPYKKGHSYGVPFYCIDDNIAATSFRECVESADGKSMTGSDLYRIADWNFKTGVLKVYPVKRFITY